MSAPAWVWHPTDVRCEDSSLLSPDTTVQTSVPLYCTDTNPSLPSPTLRFSPQQSCYVLLGEKIAKVRMLMVTSLCSLCSLCVLQTLVMFIIVAAERRTLAILSTSRRSILSAPRPQSAGLETISIFWVRKPWEIHLEQTCFYYSSFYKHWDIWRSDILTYSSTLHTAIYHYSIVMVLHFSQIFIWKICISQWNLLDNTTCILYAKSSILHI